MESIARAIGAVNAALALVGTAGVIMVVLGLTSVARVNLRRRLAGEEGGGFLDDLQARLDQAELEVTAREFLRASLLLGGVTGIGTHLLVGFPVMTILAFAAGSMMYWIYLENRRDRKVRAYRSALAEGADLIRENFAVIPSLQAVFDMVAESGPPALREDFRRMTAGLTAGASLEAVLEEVKERRRSPFLDQMAETLLVHEKEGGEIGEILKRMAESIREQIRIQQRIDAEQLRQRWTGRIVALFPFAAVVALKFIAPNYVNPYYGSALGQATLMVVAFLSFFGYWLMKKLGGRGITLGRVEYK